MKKSILIYFIGLSFAITPISAGQILRSQIIKKEFDYAFSKTSPILLFEKWSELAAVLVILVALAIFDTSLFHFNSSGNTFIYPQRSHSRGGQYVSVVGKVLL